MSICSLCMQRCLYSTHKHWGIVLNVIELGRLKCFYIYNYDSNNVVTFICMFLSLIYAQNNVVSLLA